MRSSRVLALVAHLAHVSRWEERNWLPIHHRSFIIAVRQCIATSTPLILLLSAAAPLLPAFRWPTFRRRLCAPRAGRGPCGHPTSEHPIPAYWWQCWTVFGFATASARITLATKQTPLCTSIRLVPPSVLAFTGSTPARGRRLTLGRWPDSVDHDLLPTRREQQVRRKRRARRRRVRLWGRPQGAARDARPLGVGSLGNVWTPWRTTGCKRPVREGHSAIRWTVLIFSQPPLRTRE